MHCTGVFEVWVSWGSGWVCLKEGSWGMGPPVWLCPCSSRCGRTHHGASVDVFERTCGMCVVRVPSWPVSQRPPPRKTWTSPFRTGLLCPHLRLCRGIWGSGHGEATWRGSACLRAHPLLGAWRVLPAHTCVCFPWGDSRDLCGPQG